MPLFKIITCGEDTQLGLWKITESKWQLQQILESYHLTELNGRVSHLHWLASRILIMHLIEGNAYELSKDNFNKPHLKIDGVLYHISISHTHGWAAVILSKTHLVAVDVETLDYRIVRVKDKFASKDELQFCLRSEDETIKMLTAVWSAKETLYKWYSKKELEFKSNLLITPFLLNNKFEIEGQILKDQLQCNLTVQAELLDDVLLTYIC
jgi:phosphopantetheinyl transferase